jgi:hypothetical protein
MLGGDVWGRVGRGCGSGTARRYLVEWVIWEEINIYIFFKFRAERTDEVKLIV